MKFKYTNSNNEEAFFEAVPLTTELYTELIEMDKEFLQNVAEGKEVFFKDEPLIEAAKSLLISFGKGKEIQPSSLSDTHEVLLVTSKTILKEAEEYKKTNYTPKRIVRDKMITSKIRSFKKEKMELNFDLAH